MPERIQLRRVKGWRKPEGAVVVARPGRWGNPFRVGELITPDHPGWGPIAPLFAPIAYRAMQDFPVVDACHAVDLHRAWLRLAVAPSGWTWAEQARAELAGLDLCCWCPLDGCCHADTLLEVANVGFAA